MSTRTDRQLSIHIRWMIRRDMAEVVRIEQSSFEFPWTEDDFYNCLRQRNCIGMVAEHDERVVGFMIYELQKTRLHVVNLAVHREYRRRRVGAQMVEKLRVKLSPEQRRAISLEIRETNLPAQLFFRDNQFRAVSILKGFYDDTIEDAYVMEYRCSEATFAPVNRIQRLAG